MSEYISNRQRQLKIGISSYTENDLVLDVIGNVNISGITTISGIKISSGIITASSGVVTYYGDGSKLSNVNAVTANTSGYSNVAGIATVAQGLTGTPNINVGIVTATEYYGTFKGTLDANVVANTATYADTAGIATYAVTAGIATYADTAGIATYATSSGIATYADTAGIATYATYATSSGIATYASTAGIATYATYATSSGIATYADTAGIATYASTAGISTYATSSGIATYASTAGIATYADTAGIATYATYATSSGIATYADTAGIATYATSSGIATYADTAGIATYATSSGIATYADTAGIATYASTAGIATYATFSGIATSVIGGIGSVSQFRVTGISTFTNGPVLIGSVFSTGTSFQTLQVTGGSYISGNLGIGNTNPTSKLSVDGDVNVSGVITSTTFIGNLIGTATTASSVSLNSVGLGTHTYGDYVQSITGTSNQITVTGGTGEGSSPVISIPTNPVLPGNVTIANDLQVNHNLNVTGNITIGGTSAYIISNDFRVKDADIVTGFTTDSNGNDVSNDTTANHGGIAVASTEGSPLVQLYNVSIGEINPATYKKIMWFKSGSFAGLNTDAWLINYAVGIGSTQFPSGTRLAAGSVQFTENDLAVVRNINASGIVTASSFSGNASSATYASIAGIATVAQGLTGTPNINVGIVTATEYYGTFKGTLDANVVANTATYADTAGIATYAVTAGIATYADTAGIATNIKGGNSGDILYQSATNTTNFVNSSSAASGQVLIWNGTSPSWANVTAASGAFGGITVKDEGNTVGTSNSITTLNFVSPNLTVTATSGPNGIATIIMSNDLVGTGLSFSGISTLGVVTATDYYGIFKGTLDSGVIAGYALTSGISTVSQGLTGTPSISVTNINASGISTLGTVRISSGVITATSGIVTYYGDGSKLSGINVSGSISISTNTTNSNQYIPYVTSLGSTTGLGATDNFVFNPSTGNVGIGTTNPTLTLDVNGRTRISGNSLASTPALRMTGTWFRFGVNNTTTPHLLISPTAAGDGSWNYDGTVIGINAISGYSGRFIDLQSAGISNFYINSSGSIVSNGNIELNGGYINFSSGVLVDSTGLGVLRLRTHPGNTGFGRLVFGSFASNGSPAIKASTSPLDDNRASISFRYSNDSGDCDIYAKSAVFSGITSSVSLRVAGVSTLGTVQISSGIVTATSGIVTYYGDGSKLSGINASGAISISVNTTNSNQYIPYATSFGSTTGLGATDNFVFNPSTGNVGIGTTNPTSKLTIIGDVNVSGVVTATTFFGNATTSTYASTAGIATYASTTGIATYADTAGIATYASTAGVATALQNSRIFEITGDIIASPISFNGTGNVSLAATIQPNSVALGTDTTGDYVQSITGTSNQITVTGGTGESSTPTLSIPNQFTAPQDVTVTRDLQVNRNLNVNGNITIGGTSATLFTTEFKVYDPDIVLGFRTDGSGNDVSTDTTANHGGIAIASTEGNPLVQLYDVGIGETNPATYKKIMWFKSGAFAGLNTDAWLINYAVGIGSTQFPSGTRLAAGSVQFTENDLAVVRNINASGIVTASSFVGNLTGTATTATNLSDAANITTGTINSARLSGTYNINVSYANTSGISTVSQGLTGTPSISVTNINASGISTLGTVRISSGIVTATSGVVTYYGDGSNLTGVVGTQVVTQSVVSTPVYPTFANATGVSSIGISTTQFVFIPSTGNVGLGTTNPTSKLAIIGDINVSGVVTATDFNSASDVRLKTNIKLIQNPIEKIIKIDGVTFDWKESNKSSMGVIADQIQQIIPELVSNSDPKTVNYNGLIGLLIECVKQQQVEIENLKKNINNNKSIN